MEVTGGREMERVEVWKRLLRALDVSRSSGVKLAASLASPPHDFCLNSISAHEGEDASVHFVEVICELTPFFILIHCVPSKIGNTASILTPSHGIS